MLGRVQVEGVGMGMTDQIEVMPVQALYLSQEGAVLLRCTGERDRRAGQVRQCWAAGRTVRPGQRPRRNPLREHGGLARTVAGKLRTRGMQLIGKILLWERESWEGGLCAQTGLRLQESEDARILGVFGLHPLHGGEIMHQVLHALVVTIVEVVGKLC